MSAQKYGGTMVDDFQRRKCLDVLKRNGAMSPQDISLWARLSMKETKRHLKSLAADQLVQQVGSKFALQRAG